MTTKTVKLLVLITLLVHGIGHIQGVIAGMGVKFKDNTSNKSWLFQGMTENTHRILCTALYLGAALTAILAALGFRDILIPESSWQLFALATAFLSTASLLIFPNALAMFFNKAGAIAVNLLIYYSILFNGAFPAEAFND
jgi:hypothetical protein